MSSDISGFGCISTGHFLEELTTVLVGMSNIFLFVIIVGELELSYKENSDKKELYPQSIDIKVFAR